MSYEGTTCPCGDKKERDTMLCGTCMRTFASHSAMATFQDDKQDAEVRRNAAIVLLTLARGRKKDPKP